MPTPTDDELFNEEITQSLVAIYALWDEMHGPPNGVRAGAFLAAVGKFIANNLAHQPDPMFTTWIEGMRSEFVEHRRRCPEAAKFVEH